MRRESPLEGRRTIAACLALTVVAIAVYWRLPGNDFVIFDDPDYVVENVNVQRGFNAESLRWAFTTFHVSYWHPLTWLSHAADYRLFGPEPWGHHLVSLLLHVVNSLLLFAVAKNLTASRWKSFLVAAFFSLHPLHVESVAWVSERKDVLSAFFWMLTLGAYARYVARPTTARYGQVLCFFVLGLLSKPMLVSLPLTLILLDYWPLGRFGARGGAGGGETRPELGRRILLEKVPLALLAALVSIVTVVAQSKIGALRSTEEYPLGLRLANAVVSYGAYLQKMFVPRDLSVIYFHPESYPWPEVVMAVLLVSGVTWWALRSARRAPYLVVGWLWFLITLGPVIGLVQVGLQSMADRHTYIPFVGLFVALVWGVPPMIPPSRRQRELPLLAGAVVLLLALLASRQTGYWKDSVALFSRAAQVSPSHYLSPYHLAIALELSGDVGEAVSHYERSVSLNPKFADGHNHLGVAYIKQERCDAAVASFRRALEADPDFVPARNNLRKLQLLMGHSP